MRTLKTAAVVLFVALGAIPLGADDQKPATLDQVIDRIIQKEAEAIEQIQKYSPMVETYIQNLKPDAVLGTVPNGDNYFLGRAKLSKGVELVSLTSGKNGKSKKKFWTIGGFFSLAMRYLPDGFLQMIFVDTNGIDREHYKFDYVRREFVGEVRCLVFDVTPAKKGSKGRFIGRIWVEDQDFHIVRFNGAYTGSGRQSFFFHFDSWRTNVQQGLWLPSFVYSEESNMRYAVTQRLQFKAQTRLWGYNLGHAGQEQELSKVLIESPTAIDETQTANDLAPIQAQRAWDRQAESNVAERLERIGLMAPRGDVDKVLDTVINNLEVTNNLDIQPEVRCRILLTSTLESFTMGHTIVLSRGLVDTLPDEASLAVILAHELGHVILGHRMDSQYAFFDRLLVDDKQVFRHFLFGRNADEEAAASEKAIELLKKSPYKDQLGTAVLFLQAIDQRQKQIPNLISPHLGDRIPANSALNKVSAPADPKALNQIVALPLGGRIKLDPWNDHLDLLKNKPVGVVAEREKMPFEVTPFMPYLTRYGSDKTPAPQAPAPETKPEEPKKPN